MSSKRASTKSTDSSGPDRAIMNALLVISALGGGIMLLVQRGRLSWPPYELMASISTIAGCLALVGPFVLARPDAAKGGLGELLWMTAGVLVWVLDVSALAQGQWRTMSWTSPLGDRLMGLTILAVLVAGWRCGLAGRNWSWTNVTGWALGILWIGLAVSTWVARAGGFAGLASR